MSIYFYGGTVKEQEEPKERVKTVLNDYDLENRTLLGKGGQGEAYLVTSKDGTCKAVDKEFNPSNSDAKDLEHFVNQIEICQRIDHAQVPHLIGHYEEDLNIKNKSYTVFHAVYEFIEGQNLREFVEENGGLSPQESAEIILSALEPVGYLHSLDILHRDLKPSNLIVGSDGKVHTIDLGIVKDGIDKTRHGSTMGAGSLGYVCYEQLMGRNTRSNDLYSLGAALFFCATGQDVATLSVDYRQEEKGFTEIIQRFDVDRDLAKIIQKATDPDHTKRYKTAEEMKSDLRCFLDGTLESVVGNSLVISDMDRKGRKEALINFAESLDDKALLKSMKINKLMTHKEYKSFRKLSLEIRKAVGHMTREDDYIISKNAYWALFQGPVFVGSLLAAVVTRNGYMTIGAYTLGSFISYFNCKHIINDRGQRAYRSLQRNLTEWDDMRRRFLEDARQKDGLPEGIERKLLSCGEHADFLFEYKKLLNENGRPNFLPSRDEVLNYAKDMLTEAVRKRRIRRQIEETDNNIKKITTTKIPSSGRRVTK